MNQYVADMETLNKYVPGVLLHAPQRQKGLRVPGQPEGRRAAEVDVDLGELRTELDSDPEHTGDMDRTEVELTARDRAVLSMSADECPGKKDCPFGNVCFAELAKEPAQFSNVVITNHAMLATDAMLRSKAGISMLPKERSAVVIDEAHELNDYATNALSVKMTERGFGYLASEIGNFAQCGTGDVKSAAAVLFEASRPS
jgi:ATP-dependent DNA helicase DinG